MSIYDFYDTLRTISSNLTLTTLVGDLQVDDEELATHVGRNLHRVEDTGEILCHVPTIFRWSVDDVDDISDDAYGGSAAALLAMYHFNTGNGRVVQELENIHRNCPIRFTTELIDSESSASVAMEALTRLLTRRPQDIESPQPCALLGSSLSSITKVLATVTGVYDLPHVTSAASSVELDEMSEYPLFARTHPSDASMAQLSVEYLATQLSVRYVAVLYIDNAFGNSYFAEILKHAAEFNMTLVSQGFRADASDEEISSALERLKESGYRYFLGVFFSGDYDRIMTRAMELGIAGENTFWMFNGALASMFINGQLEVPKDSLVARATFGTAILSDEGGLPGLDSNHDSFLKQWQEIGANGDLLAYINSKQPQSESISFERTRSYFETLAPSHIAAFSYDAIVGLGLSACKAYAEWNLDPTQPFFSGQLHHSEFVATTFHGASGHVIIGPDTFSRKADSTYHVVSNILPRNELQSDIAGSEVYQARPYSVYDTFAQSWRRYGSNNTFVYSSGTEQPPQQIPPPTTDYSEVSPAVRAVCLCLGGVAMVLSVAFYLYCCIVKREHRVIRAAQPFFLGLICFGSMILASSIIPATMDDTIVSEKGADVACIMRYWLFPVGFCLMFSALFSKLWRVNKLLSKAATFQRIQVKPKDVIIPLIVLVGSNLLVLTCWTILDPPHWERDVLEWDMYGRPLTTRGYCHSDRQAAFLGPLVAINGIALLLALWQAWIGRGITTDFSESKYIAMATVCIFQALFMGVPITIITEDDSTAYLFVYTTIVSVVCFSILLLIFVPKIMAIHSKNSRSGPLSSVDPSIKIGGKRISFGASTNGSGQAGIRVTMTGDVVSSTVDPSSPQQWGGPSTSYKDSTTHDSVIEAPVSSSYKEADQSDRDSTLEPTL